MVEADEEEGDRLSPIGDLFHLLAREDKLKQLCVR